ncbi:hypothetical protein [Jeotgalibacillus proteolyticus]|uniref:hypothetical protein n=1 Tax=Jeotgalibacillus proteolyticus TaxID=2082395 RepID=UPI003CF10ED0
MKKPFNIALSTRVKYEAASISQKKLSHTIGRWSVFNRFFSVSPKMQAERRMVRVLSIEKIFDKKRSL